MGDVGSEVDEKGVRREWVERACEQLLGSMPLQSYALVIRCGAQGCYVRPAILSYMFPSFSNKAYSGSLQSA